MGTVKNLSLPRANKEIKGPLYSSKVLSSIKLQEPEKNGNFKKS